MAVEQNGVKLRALVTHMWGIYDTVTFKGIFGSFNAIAIVSKWSVLSPKTADGRARRTEIGDPWMLK